jgi:hypothetical protein
MKQIAPNWLFVFSLAAMTLGTSQSYANPDSLLNDKTKENFGSILVGFGDHYTLSELPSPITMRLRNPYKERSEFNIRLSSTVRWNNREVTRSVLLDPGAEKVIRTNLRIDRTVAVQLFIGKTTVFSGEIGCESMRSFSRRMLVVHGKGSPFQFPEPDASAQYFIAGISDKNLPYNTACYSGFDVLFFHGTDPNSWASEQKKAVDLYVRLGGTIAFSNTKEKDLGVLEYWKSLKDSERLRRSSLGQSTFVNWAIKRHGSGRIFLTADNPLNAFMTIKQSASVTYGRLLSSVENPARMRFPQHFTRANKESGDHSSEGLMVLFFAFYLLILGPVVAIVYRRSSRMKLARAIIVVILGFVVLAPAIGIAIRNATAALRIFSVIEFDATGQALQCSEIHMISGGGKNYSIDLEGTKHLVGFVPTPDVAWRNYYSYSRRPVSPEVSSYEVVTSLNGKLNLKELPIAPWDRYSVFIVDQPPIKPLEVQIRYLPASKQYIVDIKNNSPHTLEKVTFGHRIPGSAINWLVQKEPLFPGERIQKTLKKSVKGGMQRRLSGILKFSSASRWYHWDRFPTHSSAWIAARVKSGTFKVEGSRVEEYNNRTVWIQGVEIIGKSAQGNMAKPSNYLGLIVEKAYFEGQNQQRGPRIVEVIPGSPAARLGIRVEDELVSVAGQTLGDQRQLYAVLRSLKQGQRVRIRVVRRSGYRRTKTFTIALAKRPKKN